MRLKRILLITSLFVALLIRPLSVSAQTQTWSAINPTCVSGEDGDVATIQGIQCALANVLSIALTTIGIAAFVIMLVASMNWLLSGGNSQKVEKAKNTFTYALIGVIVALSAFIILNLVASFTGVNTILNFWIPDSNYQWPK